MNIEDSEISVQGYGVARCDTKNRNTGGVMMYIRNKIKYNVIIKKKIISNCWCVAVGIEVNAYKGAIAVVYHSPSASDCEFIQFIKDIVESLVTKGHCNGGL